jgi:hypothetical protein
VIDQIDATHIRRHREEHGLLGIPTNALHARTHELWQKSMRGMLSPPRGLDSAGDGHVRSPRAASAGLPHRTAPPSSASAVAAADPSACTNTLGEG